MSGKRQKPSIRSDRTLAEDDDERAVKRQKLMEPQPTQSHDPLDRTEVSS